MSEAPYSLEILLERAINISTDNESSEEYLELDNGCLCCSIRDEGVAAIAKLMKKKGKFDYILLETTGLADPCKFYIPTPFVIIQITFYSRFSRYVLGK